MRNLIRFLNTYSFFFLFLAFEVVCFYLLIKNNNFHHSISLNSSNRITGGLYQEYAEWNEYFNLKNVNRELAEENQILRSRQFDTYRKMFGENILVNDTVYQKKYRYTKARVINNSTNKQMNYLTLSIGSLNGIEKGMGVIGPKGVVGVIKNVSEHYATVLSVLHRNSRISAKLKNTNYYGSMQWDGKDYQEGILVDIPNHVAINKEDTIVTSGFSAIFPEGLAVATIKDFEVEEGENFYNIRLSYLPDYKNLSYVYIVKNTFADEQKELEEQTTIEDE